MKTNKPTHWSDVGSFETIRYEDQMRILREFRVEVDKDCDVEQRIRKQNNEFWEYVEKCQNLKKKSLQSFLEFNGYIYEPKGHDIVRI